MRYSRTPTRLAAPSTRRHPLWVVAICWCANDRGLTRQVDRWRASTERGGHGTARSSPCLIHATSIARTARHKQLHCNVQWPRDVHEFLTRLARRRYDCIIARWLDVTWQVNRRLLPARDIRQSVQICACAGRGKMEFNQAHWIDSVIRYREQFNRRWINMTPCDVIDARHCLHQLLSLS
jgi:hypothetical protein